MSDGVQRDVPGSKSSVDDTDRLDGGTSRLSRKMPASSSAETNKNNCNVLSIRSRLTSARLTRQVLGSLRLCIETGGVVSDCVLSTNTLTSGGDDDARSRRRLVSSYCLLLVIDVFLQQETLSRAVCRLMKFLRGGFKVFRVRINYCKQLPCVVYLYIGFQIGWRVT